MYHLGGSLKNMTNGWRKICFSLRSLNLAPSHQIKWTLDEKLLAWSCKNHVVHGMILESRPDGCLHTLTFQNSLAHFMWTPNVHQCLPFHIPVLIGNGVYWRILWISISRGVSMLKLDIKGQVTWISFKTFLTRPKMKWFIPSFLLSTDLLKKKLWCCDSSRVFLPSA